MDSRVISVETTLFPLVQSVGGFESRTTGCMWVEFIIGSHPCSRVVTRFSSFPSSTKTNTFKFYFNQETVDEELSVHNCPSTFLTDKNNFLFSESVSH